MYPDPSAEQAPTKPTKTRKSKPKATLPPTPEPATEAPQKAPRDDLQRLRDDFRVFLWLIWKHLNLPPPTRIQYSVAHRLQHGPRRQIIMAFRGVGKSYITVAYALWILWCDPEAKVLVVSASKSLADNFSTFALRLIQEVPMLQHLAPGPGQRSSKIAFDVAPASASKDPSVRSVGITGQIAGSRADLIISDDVEVPSNSATQGQRDKLAEAVKEYDAVLKPGGRVVYLGTPQTEQSLYLTLSTRDYSPRIWPVRYPDKDRLKGNYAAWLDPDILGELESGVAKPGQPTEPTRFPEAELRERTLSYGKAGFAMQFMLDTTLSDSDRYPLKLSDLIVMALDPNQAPVSVAWGTSPECVLSHLQQIGLNGDRWHRPIFTSKEFAKYTGCVMAIDPSGRGKDETAYAIVKFLMGTLYLVEVGGFRGGYEDPTLLALAQAAKRNNVNEILIESNFGGGMFAKLLTPFLIQHYPCTVTEITAKGKKEGRIIEALEPVMMQHRLVVNESVIKWDEQERYPDLEAGKQIQYRLFYQLTRLTKDTDSLVHDDRLDAFAMAVNYWVESMDTDASQALKAHRDELLDLELEKFMANIFWKEGKESRGIAEDVPWLFQ